MKIVISLFKFQVIFVLLSFNLFGAWKQNKNITPAFLIDQTYLDVMFLEDNPNYGWACGFMGSIIRTTDGGKSWRGLQLSSGTNMQLESITFLNDKVGYVSGPVNTQFTSQSVIYKSTDGGATWFDITPDKNNTYWGHFFINENVGVLMGGECGFQRFLRTEDGGQNWSFASFNIADSKMSDALLFDANGLGYAVGSGTLWQTDNGGRSWYFLNSTGTKDWHEDIAIFNNTILLPVSFGCDGTTEDINGAIAISTDLGKNWKRVNTIGAMFGSFLLNDMIGWVVGFNRTIMYTADGGNSWINDNCGIPADKNLDDVYFINDTTGWVVGDGIYEYFIPNYEKPLIVVDNQKICEGDSTSIQVIGNFDRIIWSNGKTDRIITVTEPGDYFARVFVDSICYTEVTEKVKIEFFPKNNINFSIGGTKLPCEGDTVLLTAGDGFVSYYWDNGTQTDRINITESGTHTVTVVDSNGCSYANSIEVLFNRKPQPQIRNLYRDNFCIGDEATLIAEEGYIYYEWFEATEGKYLSNANSINVTQSGDYYVRVKDTNGCEGISRIIKITVRDESNSLSISYDNFEVFKIDTTTFGNLNCRNLTIRNLKSSPQIINDVFVKNNTAFSTPLAQFPITIASNDSVSLTVCFSPEQLGFDMDSILIFDICSNHVIPVESFGITVNSEAISKCEVPLIFEVVGFSNSFKAIFSEPKPNPSSSVFAIDFDITMPIGEEVSFNSRLADILGNFYTNYLVKIEQDVITEKRRNQKGQIIFDIANINSGYYLFLCKVQNSLISFPIIIQR